jgi:membrane-bound serine protease (ClpP class)
MFIELNHPGFGLPGLLGLGCFAVFFIIKWTQAYARMLEVVLFGIGVVLLLLEFLVIPGFGVAGILGIACVFISLVLALQGFTLPTTSGQSHDFLVNIVTVLGSFAVSGICIVALARLLPSLPLLSRITHKQSLAAAHVGEIGEVHTPGLAAMAGQVGIALTPLHPAGRGEFGERILDVVTEGEFVPRGARVRILAVRGARVVVEADHEG